MPWEPLQIAADEFTDVEDESHKPSRTSSLARAAYDLEQWARYNSVIVSVLELKLKWRGREFATSFNAAEHPAITTTGDARLKYQVGTDLTIEWKLQSHRAITALRLEIFARNSTVPFWQKTLTWDAGTCPEVGTFVLGDATDPPWRPVERAAYKVRVTIPHGSYLRRPPARWTYLDVAPKTWVKVKVALKDGDVAVKKFTAKLGLPDTYDATPVTSPEGLAELIHYQPDGNYKVLELVTPDDEGLLVVDSVVSA